METTVETTLCMEEVVDGRCPVHGGRCGRSPLRAQCMEKSEEVVVDGLLQDQLVLELKRSLSSLVLLHFEFIR